MAICNWAACRTLAADALSSAEADLKHASVWLERRALDEPEELNNSTILVKQLRALLSSLEPNSPEVIAALKAVSAKERALPLDFGPPITFKPTDELLGELCLHSNRPSEASAAFQSDLTRAPGRRVGTQGSPHPHNRPGQTSLTGLQRHPQSPPPQTITFTISSLSGKKSGKYRRRAERRERPPCKGQASGTHFYVHPTNPSPAAHTLHGKF
jgi:hypothetical protein